MTSYLLEGKFTSFINEKGRGMHPIQYEEEGVSRMLRSGVLCLERLDNGAVSALVQVGLHQPRRCVDKQGFFLLALLQVINNAPFQS